MDITELTAIVEALIFSSEKPLKIAQIAELIDLPVGRTAEVVDRIRRNFEECPSHGLFLAEVADGFQFRTRPALAFWIKKLQKAKPLRLSTAALEILAIIAYRQPLTRASVEQIRGVDCGGTLKNLLEKKLIRIAGKKEGPGRPLLYATTDSFLEVFGLRNLEELPDLKQIDQLFSDK
ncbi:MAG: SMC-Scp complex subunit ScpB [Deltaproteobacteria bacterium]|nr:SMC-Scp complex subunit ScpB [Deltaproteobacteria bacterium]